MMIYGCGPQTQLVWEAGNSTTRGLVADVLNTPAGQVSVILEGDKTYSTYTDKNGIYEINDIQPGTYDMIAHSPAGSIDNRFRVRFIKIVNDLILDMPDITIMSPGSITGTATIKGSGIYNPTAPDNSNIHVQIIGTGIDTTTDSSGNYTLTPVEIAVNASTGTSFGIPSASTYQISYSKDGYSTINTYGVSVAPGVSTTIPSVQLVQLNPPTVGILAGKVTLEAALDEDYSGIKVSLDGTSRYQITTSGGYYKFNDLPAGTYALRYTKDYYFDKVLRNTYVEAGIPVNPVEDVKLLNHTVINNSVKAYDLAMAPSGNQLAYIKSNATEGGEIALMHPDGSTFNYTLTSGAHAVGGRGLSWTWDDQELLFVKYIGSALNAYTVAVTDNTGSNTHSLIANGTDYFGVEWAPDKKSFAYYLSTSLYSVDVTRSNSQTSATTSTTRNIVPIGNVTSWSGMNWANTGRIIYSPTVAGGQSEIFTVLANGGTSMPLNPITPGNTGIIDGPHSSPAFNATWSRVAFVVKAPSTSPQGIYICDIDGYNAVRVSEDTGQNLSWTKDEKYIYYINADNYISKLLVRPL
jgi:hypothetical protein